MVSQIVIAGGGPIGNYLASKLDGYDVTILEEHTNIGEPIQCTGLVHPRVIEMIDGEESVLNSIKGFKLCFPDKRTIEVKTNETKAVVVDRRLFDNICYEHAKNAGAVVKTGSRFTNFRRSEKSLSVEYSADGEKYEIETNLLIGADGYKSNVGGCAGLECAKEIVRGIQIDVMHHMPEQDIVNVHVGKEVAPGFFAWVLPCGDFTRVGLGVSKGHGIPSKYLEKFIEKIGFAEYERTQVYSGVIPIGTPKRTYADNVMIVGDAAAQTKPLSGGGLYTGFTCAGYAADIAREAIESKDFTSQNLSRYDDLWRSEIGKELDRGSIVRKVYTNMNDKKLCEAGKLLDKPEAKSILSEGDIDYPSKLAKPLLKAVPSLLKLAPGALRSLVIGK